MTSVPTKPYPFTWQKVSEEENEERKKFYTHPATYNTEMIISTPMQVYMPAKFQEMGPKIWNFVPRPDDIWIITYPKAGTTLTQELMWQIAHGVNIESEESQKNIFLRVPFIEFTALQTSVMPVPSIESDDPMSQMALMMNDTVAWTDKVKSPRIIKTHLPLSMLPPNLCEVSKVLYVGRNPKDNCVSFYHFEKLLHNQGLDQDANYQDYATKLYLKGRLVYGDYWTHLKDAWKYKTEKNFKLIWYEDMRADLSKAIRDIADFTGYQISDAQVAKLKDHCDIEKFKQNDAVNMKPPKGLVPEEVRKNFNFIRKGIVGDWKNTVGQDEEFLQLWKNWIQNNNGGEDAIPMKFEL